MKKFKSTAVVSAIVSLITATACFKACGKRIDISDIKHPRLIDDDWDFMVKF